MKNAYFAGGCFWCITPVFAAKDGVISVRCGYSGGSREDATYEKVKSQTTLHRETICVTYDEDKISFASLVETFLDSVDVTDDGGQYIDRGRSYTLAVFCGDEGEKNIVNEKLRSIKESSGAEAFVSVEDLVSFYDAEEYHQDYYLKNPEEFEEELKSSGRK